MGGLVWNRLRPDRSYLNVSCRHFDHPKCSHMSPFPNTTTSKFNPPKQSFKILLSCKNLPFLSVVQRCVDWSVNMATVTTSGVCVTQGTLGPSVTNWSVTTGVKPMASAATAPASVAEVGMGNTAPLVRFHSVTIACTNDTLPRLFLLFV